MMTQYQYQQNKGLFITGTDTEVGKTLVGCGLLTALKQRQLTVAGMKPVASGAIETEAGLRNEDALSLATAASKMFDYQDINPYVFASPIAPHIAANMVGANIKIKKIVAAYQRLSAFVDYVVVEGVGGWRVPLSESTSLVDLVRELNLPVLLVVGLRLGCINHALLTTECIYADGLELFGWVANHVQTDYALSARTLQTLTTKIPAPLCAEIPYVYSPDPLTISKSFNIFPVV